MASETSLKKADALLAGFEVWNRRESAVRDAEKMLMQVRRKIRALSTRETSPSWDQVVGLTVLEQGMRNLLQTIEQMPRGVGEDRRRATTA